GGLFHSLGTRGRLMRTADALGLGGKFLYEPDHDFTLGQYVLAHSAGGSPIRGTVRASPGEEIGALNRGEIVELQGEPTDPAWASTLRSLRRSLAVDGLRGVSIAELVHSRGH